MYAEEQQIIVVMFSAENKNYVDMPGGGMLQDKFFQFLHQELPDFVTGIFPALTGRSTPTSRACPWAGLGR